MKPALCIAVCFTVTGCYTLQPVVATGPLIGTEVALDINDVGRLALATPIGPEIAQLEGRLVRRDSNEYVIAVSVVRQLRDVEQKWTGEKVSLKSEYVSAVHQRKFSRGRSAIIGAAAVAVVGYLVSRAISGAGQPDTPIVPIDTAHTTRYRWP
ncbi:MAG: hypothetical protein M3Y64_09560 [Gemmatimonadota bacterium]|nr:hypothetical protein [Gemmatimonadota bacterium]